MITVLPESQHCMVYLQNNQVDTWIFVKQITLDARIAYRYHVCGTHGNVARHSSAILLKLYTLSLFQFPLYRVTGYTF